MTEGWQTKKFEECLKEWNIGLDKRYLEICNCFQMSAGIIDSKDSGLSLHGTRRGRSNERK